MGPVRDVDRLRPKAKDGVDDHQTSGIEAQPTRPAGDREARIAAEHRRYQRKAAAALTRALADEPGPVTDLEVHSWRCAALHLRGAGLPAIVPARVVEAAAADRCSCCREGVAA